MEADPREQKVKSPTPEQMAILLRYRLSNEQLSALRGMLLDTESRGELILALSSRENGMK